MRSRPTKQARRSASSFPNSPSVAQAIAAHDSAAYQEALQALGNAAVRDLRIVEGLE